MSAESPTLLVDPPTSGFDYTQCVPNKPIVIARLDLKASDIPGLIDQHDQTGQTRGVPITLIADTFSYDPAVLPSMIVRIIARKVTVVNKAPIVISPKLPKQTFVFEIAAGRIVNGPIFIHPRNEKPFARYTTLSSNPTAPVFFYVHQEWYPSGTTTLSDNIIPLDSRIDDVSRTPALWNRLKALFPLACAQLYVPAERDTAIARLQWIADLSRGLASRSHPLVGEASQLNFQASSLLALAVTSSGSRPVPSWSEKSLLNLIDGQLSLLEAYDKKISNLELRQDIKLSVEALAAAWRDVATADESALKVSAELLDKDIAAQTNQYHDLLWAYEMQASSLKLAWIIFKSGMAQTRIIKTAQAALEIVGAVAQMGAAVYGAGVPDVKAAGKAADAASKQGVKVAEDFANMGDVIKDIFDEQFVTPVVDALRKLKSDMEKVMKVGIIAGKAIEKANQILIAETMDERGQIEMPELAEMASLDPEVGWNILNLKVEVMMREFINDPKGDGSVSGSKEYYVALRSLSEYGKALGTKSLTLSRLASRKLEISAQRNAVRFAVSRWAKLEGEAKTTKEKFALARSILEESELSTKRSLFVLAEGYRAAFAYANLTETSMNLRFTMNYLELAAEFNSIKRDIGTLFATPRLTQQVETGFFTIPIVRAGIDAVPTGIHALLRVGPKPQLTWNIPLKDPPFKSRLISPGRSGYFIKEAWFYLDGITPDNSEEHVVALRVSTTGNYENGYGPGSSMRFTSEGFGLDFAYQPTADLSEPPPFSPWKPVGKSTEKYLSPTPFSGWTATIERFGSIEKLKSLRIKMVLLRQDAGENS